MGGIAGIFHCGTAKPVDPARIAGMLGGPAPCWTGSGAGLGSRPAAAGGGAAPPMAWDGLTLILDGILYSDAAVRIELEAKGHRFATGQAGEMLLHAYRVWGPACLERFEGAFAVALHDAADNSLFLARDRFGIKPLHWTMLSDGALLFASELAGLLGHPLVRAMPDPCAIDDFLAHGFVPDDACIVAGVHKVPAGHWLRLRRGSPPPAATRWYRPDFSARATGTAAALADELDGRLREAVRLRMGDAAGVLLSGGIASAAVVAMMAEASPQAVPTLTVAGAAAGDARSVAARFATRHLEIAATPEPDGPAAGAEPLAGIATATGPHLYAAARGTMRISLSGAGADTVFGGGVRHAAHGRVAWLRAAWPAGWRTPLPPAIGPLRRVRTMLDAVGRGAGEAYAMSGGMVGHAARHLLYAPGFVALLGGHRADARFERALADAPAGEAIDRAHYADLVIRLPGGVLAGIDRAARAAGMEVAMPMLDHRLVAFATRLPPALRTKHGQEAWLLRKALARRLPPAMLERRAPVARPAVDGRLRGSWAVAVARLGTGSALTATGWFDHHRLSALVAAHRDGQGGDDRLLWHLLLLDETLTKLFGIAGGR
jgi:asparagine synthase (glutamine-hydrolysing)